MLFSWSLRRQFIVFAILVLLVLGSVGGVAYYFWQKFYNPRPTGPDVVAEARDLVILWSRVFPVREGIVDVAVFVENPNDTVRSSSFVYSMKLYDAKNILVAVRDGSTFVNPRERFLVFEPLIVVQKSVPTRAILTIREVQWEASPVEPVLGISVLRTTRFLEDVAPRLEAVVQNQSGNTIQNIEASAVLWNASDEAVGVSRTVVDSIVNEEEKNLVFTWPESISGVERAEILLRRIPR